MEIVKELIYKIKQYLKVYDKEMTNIEKWKWESMIRYLENKLGKRG